MLSPQQAHDCTRGEYDSPYIDRPVDTSAVFTGQTMAMFGYLSFIYVLVIIVVFGYECVKK